MAERYAALDVSKIRLTLGFTEADHFFAMACPAMARFEPQVRIGKHRELIEKVLGRRGVAFRQGMFELLPNNALVSREAAEALLRRVEPSAPDHERKKPNERDRWIVSQYRLLLSFPLLTGREQIDALLTEAAARRYRRGRAHF